MRQFRRRHGPDRHGTNAPALISGSDRDSRADAPEAVRAPRTPRPTADGGAGQEAVNPVLGLDRVGLSGELTARRPSVEQGASAPPTRRQHPTPKRDAAHSPARRRPVEDGTLRPMRLAIFRRFALVAVIALLEPLWGHWASVPSVVVEASSGSVPAHAEIGTATVPTFRQHVEAAWRASNVRPEPGRVLVALAVLGLLSLLRLTPSTTLPSARRAAPSRARRRHVIALRAPPALCCS